MTRPPRAAAKPLRGTEGGAEKREKHAVNRKRRRLHAVTGGRNEIKKNVDEVARVERKRPDSVSTNSANNTHAHIHIHAGNANGMRKHMLSQQKQCSIKRHLLPAPPNFSPEKRHRAERGPERRRNEELRTHTHKFQRQASAKRARRERRKQRHRRTNTRHERQNEAMKKIAPRNERRADEKTESNTNTENASEQPKKLKNPSSALSRLMKGLCAHTNSIGLIISVASNGGSGDPCGDPLGNSKPGPGTRRLSRPCGEEEGSG